jgi:hypothetical protein
MDKGVKVLAISSNSAQSHPQDGPQQMAAEAQKYGAFPAEYHLQCHPLVLEDWQLHSCIKL